MSELVDSPFEFQPDVQDFFAGPIREEALARLWYVVQRRGRVGTLSGPSGCGKSLLLKAFANQINSFRQPVTLLDLRGLDGYRSVWELAAELGLVPAQHEPIYELTRRIDEHLIGVSQAQQQTVIILDHADQGTGFEFLGQQLLRASELSRGGVTMIVSAYDDSLQMAGRPLAEIADLRTSLGHFSRNEARECVESQLTRRAQAPAIQQQALELLHQATGGNPRRLSRACDTSVLEAGSRNQQHVDLAAVHSALAALDTEFAGIRAEQPRASSESQPEPQLRRSEESVTQ